MGKEVDSTKVHWLSWAHDLNRWPFAHNSEKGLFDQAADVPRYFDEQTIGIPPDIVCDLQGIISKEPALLSEDAKIVLLADMITGFVEDPLWAVTALDLRPDFVPEEIARYLCIGLEDSCTLRRLFKMNRLFATTRMVEPFETQFDALYQKTSRMFVSTRHIAESLPLGEPQFETWRLRIKDEFMRKKLFRYNNEKISKGPVLRTELTNPLHAILGEKAASVLTTIDEPEALLLCKQLNITTEADVVRYLPDLHYVSRDEPAMSFSGTYKDG